MINNQLKHCKPKPLNENNNKNNTVNTAPAPDGLFKDWTREKKTNRNALDPAVFTSTKRIKIMFWLLLLPTYNIVVQVNQQNKHRRKLPLRNKQHEVDLIVNIDIIDNTLSSLIEMTQVYQLEYIRNQIKQ